MIAAEDEEQAHRWYQGVRAPKVAQRQWGIRGASHASRL